MTSLALNLSVTTVQRKRRCRMIEDRLLPIVTAVARTAIIAEVAVVDVVNGVATDTL